MKTRIKLSAFTYSLAFLLITANNTNAQVSGLVFRDYNANGQKNNSASFNENGERGIIVTAFTTADVIIASYKTSATGIYTIPAGGAAYNGTLGSNTGFIPSGTAVRIEFSGLQVGDYPAPVGVDNKGSIQFATAPATNINYAINYPDDYSQTNPRLVTSVYKKGGAPAVEPVLVSVDYTATGGSKNYPNISNEADQSQLGATYGLAYHRLSNTLFASSYQKRHTSYGSANSTGAIYKIVNPADNSTSGVSLFLDLNVLYGSNVAGNNPHPNTITDFTRDDASYGQVGKIALGDMEISEDGLSLWTINLADRNLYKIPLGSDPYNPVAPVSSAAITRYPLWNICDADNDGSNDLISDIDIRPFAIKPYHGKLYIGVITTAQSTPTVFGNLTARVFAFDPVANTFTQVLNFPLNYNRGNGNTGAVPFPYGVPAGSGYSNANAANWRPWNDVYTTAATFQWSWYDPSWTEGGYSQPIFAGIDFDDAGNMIIGLRDRFGDMRGDGVYDPGGTTLMEANGNGDLLRAVLNGFGTGWNFVVTEVTNGTEFFDEDNYGTLHEETSMGGIAIYHGAGHIISTTMDPTSNLSGGFDWTRYLDGGLDRSYEIIRRSSGQAVSSHMFAKANALGEIELLSNAAPIEIGNRVWNDTNGNGLQDAGEPGFAGVTMELYNASGTVLLATTNSDANGYWYFNLANVADGSTSPGVQAGLQVNTNYIVRIAAVHFLNQGLGPLSGYLLTRRNISGNGLPDYSDNDFNYNGIRQAELAINTGTQGQNNHTYDVGLTTPAVLNSKLGSFNVIKAGESSLLQWKTMSDDKDVHFIVQHRSGSLAQFTWEDLITVTGKQSISGSDYQFIHKTPSFSDVNYYRIAIVQVNGTVAYTEVKNIKFEKKVKLSIYPNPVSQKLLVTLYDEAVNKKVKLSVYSVEGKLLYQIQKPIATKTEIIDISSLPNGQYIVVVSTDKNVSSTTVIVQH